MFRDSGFGPNDGQPRFGNRGEGFRNGGRGFGGLLTPEELMNLNPIEGSENNDNLIGTPGGDRLEGRLGDDVLTGGDGNDLILGGRPHRFRGFFGNTDPNFIPPTDNDFFNGDTGNDTLIGGFGNDTFTGGLGEDTFVIKTGRGGDTTPSQHLITDFQLGQDQLLVPASVATAANLPISGGGGVEPNMFGLVSVDLSGLPPVIVFGDGSSVTINYV